MVVDKNNINFMVISCWIFLIEQYSIERIKVNLLIF